MSDREVTEILAEIAQENIEALDEIVDECVAVCVEVAPELGADDAVLEDSRRSIRANLENFYVHLSEGRTGIPTDTPSEALDLGRTILRRGGDPDVILRAYRRGPQYSMGVWIPQISRRVDDADLLAKVLKDFSDRTFTYNDFLITRMIDHYREEHEIWAGGAMARRAETVRSILENRGPFGVDEASQALAFELSRPLIPAVVWSDREDVDAEGELAVLEKIANGLAEDLGSHRALTVAAGAKALWSWIGVSGDAGLDLDRVEELAAARCGDGQYVAVGNIGTGLDGFRCGHEEAEHVRVIAQPEAYPGPVYRYDRLEVITLVSADRERLGRFVRRTLAGLASEEDGARRLRETLIVYFEVGGNARRAAEELHMHKNTVLYRLRLAEDLLGHPIDRSRVELELALKVVEVLGEGVITNA